jgi:hypothetical protein
MNRDDHPASLEVAEARQVSIFFVFVDRNYRYKSVATQISHIAGLESFYTLTRNLFPSRIELGPYPVVRARRSSP